MSNDSPHVPSISNVFRMFVYILLVLFFGMFFNKSCSLMNVPNDTSFLMGLTATMVGIFLVVVFLRHVYLFVKNQLN